MGACGTRMLAGVCAVSVVLVLVPVLCLVDGVEPWGGVPYRVVCRGVGSQGW